MKCAIIISRALKIPLYKGVASRLGVKGCLFLFDLEYYFIGQSIQPLQGCVFTFFTFIVIDIESLQDS
jgi:hypothetical protein